MSNAGTRETNEIEGPDKDAEGNKNKILGKQTTIIWKGEFYEIRKVTINNVFP